jgi:hypothetical protein
MVRHWSEVGKRDLLRILAAPADFKLGTSKVDSSISGSSPHYYNGNIGRISWRDLGGEF